MAVKPLASRSPRSAKNVPGDRRLFGSSYAMPLLSKSLIHNSSARLTVTGVLPRLADDPSGRASSCNSAFRPELGRDPHDLDHPPHGRADLAIDVEPVPALPDPGPADPGRRHHL